MAVGSSMYDHIVVGGGSAGATVAGRLAEGRATKVMLLEAGPAWHSSEMPEAVHAADPAPVGSRGVTRFTDVHWQDLQARRSPVQEPYLYPRGRGLGGTSNVNAQMAIRPPLDDFLAWEAYSPIWREDRVLDAFITLESDLDFGGASYHGASGPLPIVRLPESGWGSLARQLSEAALDLGHQWCADHNAPGSTGVSPQALNRRNGRRVTSNEAYLDPVRQNDNLHVRGGALVDRVLFDGAGRAVGVRYLTPDGSDEVFAGQVILAAGSIGSPTILMRSGIGPSARLSAAGIAVRLDLPVGRGLQDHPMINIQLVDARDVEVPSLAHQCPVVVRMQPDGGRENDAFIYPMTFNDAQTPAGLSVKLACSDARGELWVTSPDPATPPVIEQSLLGHQRDMDLLTAGVRHLVDLLRHPVWKRTFERAVTSRTGTAVDEVAVADDRQLAAILLRDVTAGFHMSSACPMGSVDDGQSVVDGEGRVHGIDGLRIVDLSICPTVVRANTHLTAVMLAERLMEVIRA